MAEMDNVEGVHRLTPTQAGMLYEILSNNDPSLYFEQVRADIATTVDVDRFRRAWQAVLDRHEALRTIIVWDGLEEPVQVVRKSVDLRFEFLDWSERPDPSAELDRLATLQREAGLELSKAPLSAITLVKLDARRSHLVWNFHHIIADGWSAAIVMDDVLAAYDDAHADSSSADSKSANQEVPKFSDYIAWVIRQDREAGLQYWDDLLAGVEAPTRFAVSAGPTPDYSRYLPRQAEIFVEPDLADQIQKRSRELRVTTNTLLQGACALTFSAFSNERDVTFGVTTGGRPSDLPGIERSVGMYLKTLPFRADTSEQIPTAKWLTQLQEQQLSADEHAHVGLAEAITNTELAGAQSPFDLVWIYENFPKAETDRSLDVTVKSVFEQTNYPMTVMAGPKDGRLMVKALYNGNILSDAAVTSFLAHLVDAARLLVADEDQHLSDLGVVNPAEITRLVRLGEGPKAALGDDLIHELFDARAKQNPDSPALIGDTLSLTFDELRTHSNWLAAKLIRIGVTPGSTVGVQMKRSPKTIVALLAVAKAGAAYVPLDPSHPESRRQRINQDAETVVVLTEEDLVDLGHSANSPGVQRSPLDPLLITFTSGSTGAPKGVPVHHRGVVNRLQWQWDAFGSDPAEVMTHKTSFTFVDHLFEVWGGLLLGRSIVVIGEEVAGNPDELVNVLAANNVTQISLVPSLLSVLCELENLASRLPQLKLWTVSGEPISADLAQRFYDLVAHATLLNFYGMSEASQDSTWFQIPNPVGPSVPIGRAISNLTTYIVGPNNHLSPNGVVGELCLSGEGLSLGYLNRPDLTAEKFIPNPFGPGVLYRTGDLARRRSDGNLELAGRVDRQVKIRGVRVEPDGVEMALRKLDSVDEAAVICVDSTLIGYVVGLDVDPQTIRTQLAESVPDAMVPSRIYVVAEMPRTASGKLDRQSLPAMTNQAAVTKVKPADAAMTDRSSWGPELEAMIDLWSVLLSTPVGPDDDFFSIGGHSLLGLRLFSRIKKDLGYSLSLSQLANAKTPRSLLEAAKRTPIQTWTHLVPMLSEEQLSAGESLDRSANLFCMHGAGGNILNLRDLAAALAPQRRLIAVKATGADDDKPLPTSMDELLEPYVVEIDQFQPTGAIAIAGFSNGGLAAYEVARRLISRGRTVSGVILLDTFHPSSQPQAYGLDRHLDDIKRDPIGTLKFKANEYAGKAKIAAIHKFDWASELWEAEATHANLMRNNINIWAGYEPGKLEAKVSLLSAADTHPNWLHLGPNRQWPAEIEIEVVIVPGDHSTHVEGANALPTAAAIHRQLAI